MHGVSLQATVDSSFPSTDNMHTLYMKLMMAQLSSTPTSIQGLLDQVLNLKSLAIPMLTNQSNGHEISAKNLVIIKYQTFLMVHHLVKIIFEP